MEGVGGVDRIAWVVNTKQLGWILLVLGWNGVHALHIHITVSFAEQLLCRGLVLNYLQTPDGSHYTLIKQ